MNVPNRKEGESELEHLRRKEIAFGIWQGDALERLRDLEGDLAQAVADRDKYRLALNQLHDALWIAQRYAMLQGHEMNADAFARDFAPFRNVMAHHGVEPYAKPKRTRKVDGGGTVHNGQAQGAEGGLIAGGSPGATGSAADTNEAP